MCSRGKQAREKLTQTATSQPEYAIYHNVGYRLFGYWNRMGSEGKKRRSSAGDRFVGADAALAAAAILSDAWSEG